MRWTSFLATTVLMSCGSTSSDGISSAFRLPDSQGRIPTNLIETQSAVVDGTIGIVAGRSEGRGLRAYAGVVPDQPEQQPLMGEAIFRGPYTVAYIEDIAIMNNFISGRNSLLNGTITLETDLAEMTVFGTDGILTVRARIVENTSITGEVDVLNAPGVLEGEIGEDRVFGAFHGGDTTHLMSGGFVAARQP